MRGEAPEAVGMIGFDVRRGSWLAVEHLDEGEKIAMLPLAAAQDRFLISAAACAHNRRSDQRIQLGVHADERRIRTRDLRGERSRRVADGHAHPGSQRTGRFGSREDAMLLRVPHSRHVSAAQFSRMRSACGGEARSHANRDATSNSGAFFRIRGDLPSDRASDIRAA